MCKKDVVSGTSTAGELRRAELLNGVTALANPFVIMELASHLRDPNDPNFAECRCALTALHYHCRSEDGLQVNMIADPVWQTTRRYFGQAPIGHEETTQTLSWLVCHVADRNGENLDPNVVAVCEKIHQHLAEVEYDFVDVMRNVIKNLNPDCAGWEPFSGDKDKRKQAIREIYSSRFLYERASVLLEAAASMIPEPHMTITHQEAVEDIVRVNRPAMELERWVWIRMAETGLDMSKPQRRNTIWDVMIAMVLGGTIESKPLILVTSDKDFRAAAQMAGVPELVIDLRTHFDDLGLSRT